MAREPKPLPKSRISKESPKTIVTEDITCPSCGRHDAIVTKSNVGLLSGFRTTLTHSLCGYEESLENCVFDIFHNHVFTVEVTINNDDTLHLNLVNVGYKPHDLASAMREVTAIGYFKDIDIIVPTIKKAACPICDGKVFVKSGVNLHCKKDHLSFSAFEYLSYFLSEKFWITNGRAETDFDIESIYGGSVVKRIFTVVVNEITSKSLANVLYRYVEKTKEMILIVSRITATPAEFQTILNILTDGLPNFKIIVKLTDDDKPTILGVTRKGY